MNKWDARFFELAETIASWSKDPECKVGAVLTAPDRRAFAPGYNGFPIGVEDSFEALADKELKNSLMVHAELNAILNARRDLSGWTLYSTRCLCLGCAKAVKQAGIAEVVMPRSVVNSSWHSSNLAAILLLEKCKVNITWSN